MVTYFTFLNSNPVYVCMYIYIYIYIYMPLSAQITCKDSTSYSSLVLHRLEDALTIGLIHLATGIMKGFYEDYMGMLQDIGIIWASFRDHMGIM